MGTATNIAAVARNPVYRGWDRWWASPRPPKEPSLLPSTRSFHHGYCCHVLLHSPLLSRAWLTLCPGDSPCWSRLCCMEEGEFLLAPPHSPPPLPVVLAWASQMLKEIWSKDNLFREEGEGRCRVLAFASRSAIDYDLGQEIKFLSLSFHVRNTGKTIVTISKVLYGDE